jgi:hypothetical protein
VLDQIRYREYKILLRADRCGEVDGFEKFWHKIEAIADKCKIDITLSKTPFKPQKRDIRFYDTKGFDLYRNAFILRQRTPYDDRGRPSNEHELTFKFRHPDLTRFETLDLHSTARDEDRIKFKEELLPLREQIGGLRSLYSHNRITASRDAGLSQNLHDILQASPAHTLACGIKCHAQSSVEPVNDVAVEETEVEPGAFNFGHDFAAKATIAVWRDRETNKAMVGEFGFQAKFHDYDDIHHKARAKSEAFFRAVQTEAPKWLHLGTTKTALIYAQRGTAPNHE